MVTDNNKRNKPKTIAMNYGYRNYTKLKDVQAIIK